MSGSVRHILRLALGVLAIHGSLSPPAWACATCFGDPESDMAKGVVVGVALMIGITGLVLTGIAGTSLYWVHRSRRQPQGDRSEPAVQ